MKISGSFEPDPSVSVCYGSASAFTPRIDPLIFDLDGDGIETVGTDRGILFDHDGDGVKSGTGWVSADDGFLVYDKNNDGIINNGGELFGDFTRFANGTLARDGFDALRTVDINNDGVINVTDTSFNSLKIWRDINQDGQSQANELFSLSTLNISAINLTKTTNNQSLTNGNQLLDTGIYTKTNGSTGRLGEVNLGADSFNSQFTDSLDTTSTAALPEMRGSGLVREVANDAQINIVA